MIILGLDCSCPVIQLIAATILVGLATFLSLLKFYCFITCGIYSGREKMDGKTVLITGANGGIGLETARELAKRGAKVIMACRNIESGNRAKDDIIKSTGNSNIVVKKLNLSSQKSIREFAAEINNTETKLHVLIHNAGTAESKTKVTEDGLELTMATNHFGPFLLTHLLIDLLKKSTPSRIVIVASELYRICSLNLEKINPINSYFPVYIYYVSKYANICFTRELAKKLEGSGVTANCLHPGMINSGIWRNAPAPFSWPLKLIVRSFFKTTQQGCQTSVYLAASEEVETINGKYFVDCKEKGLNRGAMDDEKAEKLWELSVKLSNLQPTDPKI